MNQETKIVQKATFNPSIKSYIFFISSLILFVSIAGIPILIFWLFGFGQLYSRKFYENLGCELHTKNLQFKKGVLFKIEKTIPLENIQDLTFIDNPILRLFDLRILKIETAGQSNPEGSSDMKLVGIVDTKAFKERVIEQREIIGNYNQQASIPQEISQNSPVELLKEIRDLLIDIKNK